MERILKVVAAAFIAILAPSTLPPLINAKIPEADAVTCSTASGSHCYAYERLTQTTYGNTASTQVTQLTLPSNYCSTLDFSDVQQWLYFPDGSWLENGYTLGTVQNTCVSTPTAYHAWKYSGVYNAYNDGSVTVGSVPRFDIIDAAVDGTWFYLLNGVSVDYKVTTNYTGAAADVGTETTTNNAGIPSTDMDFIGYDDSSGTTHYWASASSTRIDNPPLWLIQCSPNYEHIKVGTGSTGTC